MLVMKYTVIGLCLLEHIMDSSMNFGQVLQKVRSLILLLLLVGRGCSKRRKIELIKGQEVEQDNKPQMGNALWRHGFSVVVVSQNV
jgi:hypothetical protein